MTPKQVYDPLKTTRYRRHVWVLFRYQCLPRHGEIARPEKFSRERNYISPEGYLPDGDSDVVLRTPRRLTYVPVLRLSVGEGEWLFLLVPFFQVSICPSFLSNDRYGGVERATIWSRFPASSCQLFHERALGIRWLIMPR